MGECIAYPLDGILDLHVFRPKDVPSVVMEYLRACRERGILRVRVIHGKGRSVLRGTVHRLLDGNNAVESYTQASGDASGWGATIVFLHPAE